MNVVHVPQKDKIQGLRIVRLGAPVLLAVSVALLGACGGGGGGAATASPAPSPVPSPPSSPPPPPAPAPPPMPVPPPPEAPVTEMTLAGTPPPVHSLVEPFVSRQLQSPSLAAVPGQSEVVAVEITGPASSRLLGLDAATLATRWSVDIDGYISRIAISDDAQVLYGLLPDTASVLQFSLARLSEVRRFRVADRTLNHGPLDLAIRPGFSETVVVSIGSYQAFAPFLQISVFDAGVPRPISPSWTGSGPSYLYARAPEVEFVDDTTLLTVDNETTECQLQTLRLVSTGLQYVKGADRGIDCFGVTLQSVQGRLFTSDGAFIDPQQLRVTQVFSGVDNNLGVAVYQPGLRSLMRLNPLEAGAENGGRQLRIELSDYAESRDFLRRSAHAVVETPLAQRPSELVVVLNAVPVGTAHVVFGVYDTASGIVTVLSKDVSTIAPLAPLALSPPRRAESGAYTVRALALPVLERVHAFDRVGNRFVFGLPSSIGPSGASLVVVDPGAAAVERVIPLPGEPFALAVAPTARIAYVRLARSALTLKVDLVTGQVLRSTNTAPVRGIAVHPSDPDLIAIRTLTADASSPQPTLGTLRNLVPDGPVLDIDPAGDLLRMDQIHSYGQDGLVGVDLRTTTPVMGLFRFRSGGGLVTTRIQPLAIGSTGQVKFGFDRLVNKHGVMTVDGTQMLGTFGPGNGIASDVTLDAADRAVMSISDSVRFEDGLKITWLQPVPGQTQWSPVASLLIDDRPLARPGRSPSTYALTDAPNGTFAVIRRPVAQFVGGASQVYFITRAP